MVYRDPAEPNQSVARKRPAPALVLHRPAPWVAFAASLVFAAFALLFFPLARGATLDCRRAAPGTTPECTLRSAMSSDEIRFAGTPRALGMVVRDETNAETMLEAEGAATRVLHDPAARAAVQDFESFVATPEAVELHRRVRGPRFHGLIVLAALVAAIALAISGATLERAHRLIVDAEVDELLFESVSLARRARRRTYTLSKIEGVFVDAVAENAENVSYDLSITIEGVRYLLFRADPSRCQRAAALIRASTGID